MTMKLRNRLLALACLLIFLTLGCLIFLTSGPRKPFAVILFVADNINPACLAATRIYSGGGDSKLQLEEFPNTALCRNASSDFSVPDTAAASTQIAAGGKTPNGKLCLDNSGSKLPTLLEEAALRGRSTALVTTGNLFSPSAAAFYAKTADPSNTKEIRDQFRDHPPFDMVIGYSGDPDLTPEFLPKETQMVRSPGDLDSVPFWKRSPLAAQLPARKSMDSLNAEDSLSLSDLVRIAIRRLQLNGKGYLLVVDDPGIAAAASANDGETMLRRIAAFDRAVSTAKHYAGDKAMIVVTGRENIGGIQLNGHPFLHDKGVAVVALNNLGYPSLSWSTGPGYAVEPQQDGKVRKNSPGILTQPSSFSLPKGIPTSGDVVAAGTGQGTERIRGFLDLSEIHRILSESL
jgi:alkaline phosphatase